MDVVIHDYPIIFDPLLITGHPIRFLTLRHLQWPLFPRAAVSQLFQDPFGWICYHSFTTMAEGALVRFTIA